MPPALPPHVRRALQGVAFAFALVALAALPLLAVLAATPSLEADSWGSGTQGATLASAWLPTPEAALSPADASETPVAFVVE